MPAKQPLRILCFGDSLTEGYSMFGMQFTPYSETMEIVLNERLNKNQEQQGGPKWDIEVETNGVSGQLVTAGFTRRMERICMSNLPSSIPFSRNLSLRPI